MKLIDKDVIITEIERRINFNEKLNAHSRLDECNAILSFIDSLEVKEVDVSNISENLAEAYEYLDYTSTGNLAHNKPMVSARLKKAIRGLFDARLFELTHDKQYRMESLGLKAQKEE